MNPSIDKYGGEYGQIFGLRDAYLLVLCHLAPLSPHPITQQYLRDIMKLSEIAHFSEDKYREHIADKYSNDQDLGTEIYKKRAKRLSSKVRVGVGAAAAPLTGGGTLVSAAFSGRNISVESQKLELLEEEWANRGYAPLPERRLKDKIVPVLLTAATSTFAAGMDAVFAVASPDQFAQLVPNTEINDFLISNVYYGGLEQGATSVKNAVVNKVVAARPEDMQ